MAMTTVNGVELAYEISGTGEVPLVMVHGSWIGRRQWDAIVLQFPDDFRIVTYDRRGHSESERPNGQSSIRANVADLAALIEHLGLAPAWVAGNSFGGSITLRLAGERPDLLQGITAHEPPLFSLIKDDTTWAQLAEKDAQTDAEVAERIASGDHAGAAEQFVEANAPGLWIELPPDTKREMIGNAPSFREEANDPDFSAFDLEWIRRFPRPALLTIGDQSPPQFAPVIIELAKALPSVDVNKFAETGHVPHMEHPEAYVEAITAFIRKHTT